MQYVTEKLHHAVSRRLIRERVAIDLLRDADAVDEGIVLAA
jgi:hypothetical protein